MTNISATSGEERIGSLDIVRGLALFGIMMINLVMEFRVSLFQQFSGPLSDCSPPDRAINEFLLTFFDMSAFAVFSFLFGVGLAAQYQRNARTEDPLRLLLRRLLVLLAFGLIHLCLIWNGDILTEYAIAGLVVLPFLFLSTRALVFGLLLCVIARVVGVFTVEWIPVVALAEHAREATDAYAHADYLEYLRYSVREIGLLLPLHLWVFPRTAALFLIGIWSWRYGVFHEPQLHRRLLVATAIVGTALGFALPAIVPVQYVFSGRTLDAAEAIVDSTAQVALALGYVSITVCIVEFTPFRWLVAWTGPLGRMSFTNYIAQSIIFGWIFFGYGLGLMGKMSVLNAALLCVIVYAVQALISGWWLQCFNCGPLEWLWRTLMYGRSQPMRMSTR